MAAGANEKTEKATPKKRRDERKKGNVMVSKDAVAVATLFATYFIMRFALPMMAEAAGGLMRFCIGLIGTVPTGGASSVGTELTAQCTATLARSVALPLLTTVLASVAATFAQTRLLVSFDSLKPKFSRMNPLQGIKKLFSMKSIVEALKGLIKITVLIVLIFLFMQSTMHIFMQFVDADIMAAVHVIMEKGFALMLQVGVAFLAVAFFDFLYQRWEFERDMKMTKQEIKEEYKQMEGDPQIKGKIKETQRRMAQSRMMQAVPEADVVIRNPTHFAVALRYRPGEDNAPVVLAKGQDHMALRIVGIAEEHRVAVVENKPLAQGLYKTADIGQPISPEFYGAVADVLVYIYKLGKK